MTVLLQDLQTVLAPLASGGAWYGVNDSQPPVLPYIVYGRVVSTTNNSMQGASDLQNTRIQVDVYARTIAQAESIADTVGGAMLAGPWKSAVALSSQDFYETETRLHRISRDFSVWATN